MSKSIMQTEKRCYFCDATKALHRHHVFFGTANRRLSEKYGCWVWLCFYHHNGSKDGVHARKELDLGLKQRTQAKFEETHTREEFMRIFGRSWL